MIRCKGIEIDRANAVITHGIAKVHFGGRWREGVLRGKKFMLVQHLILSGGVTKKQLFDLFYGDDPDGGPLDGFHIFDIYMSQIKSYIVRLHLHMHKEKRGGETYYRLEPNVV